jgi:hypothetical protein
MASKPPRRLGQRMMSVLGITDRPGFVLLVETVYLLVLFVVGLLYVINDHTLGPWKVPTSLGLMPTGVPWFGALGSVLISLKGIVDHRKDWDSTLKYWHFTRPLIGAALAIISVLIFQAGILAVGSSPTSTNGTATNLLYYLIAFMVGYREEVFRELIKRLADVILTPGGGAPSPAAPTVDSVNPSSGKVAGGDLVAIAGSSFADVIGVKFGPIPVPAADVQVDSINQVTVKTPVAAQQTAGTVRITVTTKAGSATGGQFTYV